MSPYAAREKERYKSNKINKLPLLLPPDRRALITYSPVTVEINVNNTECANIIFKWLTIKNSTFFCLGKIIIISF